MFDSAHGTSPSLQGVFACDRRADARYEYEASGETPALADRQESFSVRILNLSAGGLALLADQRIERGTLLSVELPSKDEYGSRRLVMAVKKVEAEPAGSWKIGCQFSRKLSALELLALL